MIGDCILSGVVMCFVCLLIAEVGDYCEEFDDQEYFSRVKLLPNQSRTIQLQIMSHYKEHMYELENIFTFLYFLQIGQFLSMRALLLC